MEVWGAETHSCDIDLSPCDTRSCSEVEPSCGCCRRAEDRGYGGIRGSYGVHGEDGMRLPCLKPQTGGEGPQPRPKRSFPQKNMIESLGTIERLDSLLMHKERRTRADKVFGHRTKDGPQLF